MTFNDKELLTLTLKQIQAFIVWCFEAKNPCRKHLFSRLSKTKPKNILSVNVFLVKNISLEATNNFSKYSIKINEYLSIDDLFDYLPCKTVEVLSGFEINKNDLEKFIITDFISAYSVSDLPIPPKVSLYAEQSDGFVTFEKKSEYFLVSLDCEMLITDLGKEIGRISIVDHKFNIIYDKYVQPIGTVVDYLTKFSGLTKENIASGISFEKMIDELKNIIGKNTIIWGHSLENDLFYLKIKHHLIIDTSHLFMTKKCKQEKLKNIYWHKFKISIQNGEHSSVEDAKSTLKLLHYKITEYKMAKYAKENGLFIDYGNDVKINFYSFFEFKTKRNLNSKNLNFIKLKDDETIEAFKLVDKSSVNFVFYEENNCIKLIIK